jgi:PIN domain nuclease of toxin-antitoxin system
MRLLLDTHTLLWFVTGDPRLGKHGEIIADPAHDVFVSTVSLMEIAVKIRAGKLRLEMPDLLSEMERQGFDLLPLTSSHVLELTKLPIHADHKDPFDHQLIAQAIAEDMPFLSQDRHAGRYPVRLL